MERRLKVPTIVMVRPQGDQVAYKKKTSHTKIELNWPTSYVKSKWYILCKHKRKVYLTMGSNLIGQLSNNHILIRHPNLVISSELSIQVTGNKACVSNASGVCLYNGERMGQGLYELEHDTTISVVAPKTAIMFRFLNKVVSKQLRRTLKVCGEFALGTASTLM